MIGKCDKCNTELSKEIRARVKMDYNFGWDDNLNDLDGKFRNNSMWNFQYCKDCFEELHAKLEELGFKKEQV